MPDFTFWYLITFIFAGFFRAGWCQVPKDATIRFDNNQSEPGTQYNETLGCACRVTVMAHKHMALFFKPSTPELSLMMVTKSLSRRISKLPVNNLTQIQTKIEQTESTDV